VATQSCCVSFSLDAGGLSRSCQNGTSCPSGGTQRCDEAADCPVNNVCCASFTGGNGAAECQSSCQGQQSIQLCKTNAECSGGACGSYTCFGQPVRSCTQPPGCQ
jgi:hypothetical protein